MKHILYKDSEDINYKTEIHTLTIFDDSTNEIYEIKRKCKKVI